MARLLETPNVKIEEELEEFIKNSIKANLSVSVDDRTQLYGPDYKSIKLYWGGEEFYEESL